MLLKNSLYLYIRISISFNLEKIQFFLSNLEFLAIFAIYIAEYIYLLSKIFEFVFSGNKEVNGISIGSFFLIVN